MKSVYKRSMAFITIALLGFAAYSIVLKVTDLPIASWHMINVNSGKLQGDAHLLRIGNTTVMIDAGYVSEARIAVVPYLKELGIKKVDHFFISHPHRDHYEGLAAILDAGIPIINLYYKIPSPEVKDCCYSPRDFKKFIDYAKDRGSKLIQPQTGFKLSLPHESTLEILHAQEGNLPNAKIDVNDLSLIIKWEVNGSSVLFPGDLNKKLGKVLSNDSRMRSDILKMPHHGVASLAPNVFFESVNPDYVLVPGPKHLWCSGRGSRPRKWTSSKKLPTWVNGLHGNIKVEFKRDVTVFSPERPGGSCQSG